MANPAPISAPTTVCVPDIGIPKIEEDMMKMNEPIDDDSMASSKVV